MATQLLNNDASQLGIVFDCDGVLLDSMGAWHSLDDKLAARANVELTQKDRDYLTASSIPECAQYLYEVCKIGTSAENVRQMLDDEMYVFYSTEVKPKPGALEFVQGLHDAGIPMAVASSTPHYLLVKGLEVGGFAPYMQAIVSVDDVGKSKRYPDVYDKARSSFGLPREQTWGMEDSLYAIKTLNGAGYHTLATYDSDIAGIPSALKEAAQIYTDSFLDLSAQDFLKLASAIQ